MIQKIRGKFTRSSRIVAGWVLVGFAIAAGVAGVSRATLPAGLDARVAIGAYLDGKLPTTSAQAMPALLSQTGAFSNTPNMVPHAGLVPYDLNSPLWSDAATKMRWIALPFGGTTGSPTVGFSQEGNWTYPGGTVFVKHFDLVINEQTGTTRRLETRLLVRDSNGGVYGASYRWRQDNLDAVIVTDPETETGIVVTRADGVTTSTQDWLYPGQQQCIRCHNDANAGDPNGTGMILGLKTRQLNKDYAYPAPGRTDNQLNTWSELGMFNTTLSASAIAGFGRLAPLSDTSATLEHRLRSYVDSNCAFCHQPGAEGPIWDARFSTPILAQNIAGDANNPGAVLLRFNLAQSRMHIRDSVDPRVNPFGMPMPPIARNVPHAEWLALMGALVNYPFDSIEALAVVDPNKISIRFDRAVDPASAADAGNYAVNNGVTVSAAAVDGVDPAKVVLTTSAMSAGTSYQLTINRVKETTAPFNPIWPNTAESFVFSAAPLAQSINFGPLADRQVPGSGTTVSATGGASGQPVVFTTLTSSICNTGGTNGSNVTLTGTPGLCIIAANQAGNANYAPASQVTQSFKVRAVYNVVLQASQAVPINASLGYGTGTVTYDATIKQLKLNLSYSNLAGAESGASLHGPASRGNVAGTMVSLMAGSPKTDTITLDATQEAQLLAGQLYVNIRSSLYANGELRGQIDNLGSTGAAGTLLKVVVAGASASSIHVGDVNGPALNCGSDDVCLNTFPANSTVFLTGYFYDDGDPYFIQWSGCDSNPQYLGEPGCSINMNRSRTVYVSYYSVPLPPIITRIDSGDSQATVHFDPAPFSSGQSYQVTCTATGFSPVAQSGSGSPIVVTGLTNGTAYSCVATYGLSGASNAAAVTPQLALELVSLKSRKVHGGNTTYDLPLVPVAGNAIAVEPRLIGSAGHKLLFQFNQTITSLTSVSARDAANNDIADRSYTVAGNVVSITLNGLPNNQRVNVTLSGLNGVSDVSRTIGFLAGDVTGSGSITAADIAAVKARTGQQLSQDNSRFDINGDGQLSAADLSIVKSRAGAVLP